MFETDAFIEDCRRVLRDSTPQLAMKELMLRTVEQGNEIMRALGEPTAGGIDTLYRADDLTVLRIVWTPHMTLYPHDHNMWAVIGIYGGQEDNGFYRRAATGLSEAGGKSLYLGDVVALGRDVIHAVHNPRGREFTQALHVYGGDFFGVPRREWDPVTLEEQRFDIERVRRVFAEANERYQAELAGDAQQPSKS